MRQLLLIGLLFTAVNSLRAEQPTPNKQKLAEKLIALQKLRAEIDQLRRETGESAPQLLIRIHAMEIDTGRLSKAGLNNPLGMEQGWRTFDQQSLNEVLVAVDNLVNKDFAKVHADVAIKAEDGRSERYRSGSEHPNLIRPRTDGTWETEMKFVGMDLEFEPSLLADDQIELDCNFRLSERDQSHDIVMPQGVAMGIRTKSLCTRLQMKLGETLMISGALITRTGGEAQLVWLISCERLRSPDKQRDSPL